MKLAASRAELLQLPEEVPLRNISMHQKGDPDITHVAIAGTESVLLRGVKYTCNFLVIFSYMLPVSADAKRSRNIIYK